MGLETLPSEAERVSGCGWYPNECMFCASYYCIHYTKTIQVGESAVYLLALMCFLKMGARILMEASTLVPLSLESSKAKLTSSLGEISKT